MAELRIRRIHCSSTGAAGELLRLRTELGSQGNVVSARGRALTEKVFGQALTPAQVVERVCNDVRERGLDAVLHYTEEFDRVRLTPETLRVGAAELGEAHAAAAPAFLETVRRVRQNVLSFQCGILQKDAVLTVSGS